MERDLSRRPNKDFFALQKEFEAQIDFPVVGSNK